MAAVQVVAWIDGAVELEVIGMLGDPALGGVALAVLFAGLFVELGIGGGGVGLGSDELGRERDDAVVAVGDDGGGDHGVEVLGGCAARLADVLAGGSPADAIFSLAS